MSLKLKRADTQNVRNSVLYKNRLMDLALSVFDWHNLPPTVDERFIEVSLINNGSAVWFKDEIIGNLCLPVMMNGNFDVYNTPINRRAYAANGYQMTLTAENSVLIYNNFILTNMINDIVVYANLLTLADRIIEINLKRQKTPYIIRTTEQLAMTMKNIMAQVDNNDEMILTDKNVDIPHMLESIDITAPFVANDVFTLKRKIWGEAMNFIGLTANTEDKPERQVVQEVDNYNQNTYAQRFTRLAARQNACKKINEMFGLDISVTFRADIETAGIHAKMLAGGV